MKLEEAIEEFEMQFEIRGKHCAAYDEDFAVLIAAKKYSKIKALLESSKFKLVPVEFYVSQDEYDMTAHADMYWADKAVYEETIKAAPTLDEILEDKE